MRNLMTETNANWVRHTLLERGPLTSTVLISLANGVLYPKDHSTLWRRADRAIQFARRYRWIDYDEKRRRWQAFRKGGTV